MRKFDLEEKEIQEALSQIKVNAHRLPAQVKDRLQEDPLSESSSRRLPGGVSGKSRSNSSGRSRLRPVAIALLLSAMLVITAAASSFGSFDWLMERLNPTYGDIVELVEITCEDQGIQLEIIGGQKYENQAVVYLSLQDVTGQNRITEQTDFRDGFSIKMAEPSEASNAVGTDSLAASVSWQSTLLHLDEETNTAYFEFVINADPDSPLTDPLTLGSSLIYFEEIFYEYEPVNLSLGQLEYTDAVNLEEQYLLGGSGNLDHEILQHTLKPDYVAALSPDISDKWISGVNYIDGKLHVQLTGLWQNQFGSSDFNLSLVHDDGEITAYDYEFMFIGDDDYNPISIEDPALSTAPYKHSQMVFTVSEEELDNYTLCFTGYSFAGVKGTWKLTAHLSDISEQLLSWKNETPVEDHLFEHLTFSPLGIQVIGSYQTSECLASQFTLAVETTQGLVTLDGGGGTQHPASRTFHYHWNTLEPLDVKTISAIHINDVRIPIE